MKNLTTKAIIAKNKLESVPMRAKAAVLCALKAIVTAIIGSDPTTMTFY